VGGKAYAGYIKIEAKLCQVELNWGLAELGNIQFLLKSYLNFFNFYNLKLIRQLNFKLGNRDIYNTFILARGKFKFNLTFVELGLI
jgi:hypothetical protein